MDKSKIQKSLTQSQIKEIRKIVAETAELRVILKIFEEAARLIQSKLEKEIPSKETVVTENSYTRYLKRLEKQKREALGVKYQKNSKKRKRKDRKRLKHESW